MGTNDLSGSIFLSGAAAPTTLQFAQDTQVNPTSLGGYLDITLAGSTEVFKSVSEWMQKLGSSTPPIISG